MGDQSIERASRGPRRGSKNADFLMVLGLGVTSPIAVYFLGCCGASRAHRRTVIRALMATNVVPGATRLRPHSHKSSVGSLHFTAKRRKVFAVPSVQDRDDTVTARGREVKTVPRGAWGGGLGALRASRKQRAPSKGRFGTRHAGDIDGWGLPSLGGATATPKPGSALTRSERFEGAGGVAQNGPCGQYDRLSLACRRLSHFLFRFSSCQWPRTRRAWTCRAAPRRAAGAASTPGARAARRRRRGASRGAA